MTTRKYSVEWILERIHEFLGGSGTYKSIAKKYGVSESSIRQWVAKFKMQGPDAFIPKSRNASYTKEFKLKCVQAVLNGEGTITEIALKNNVSSQVLLSYWLKQYNSNIEIKDYNPNQEVYMAKAKRDTTLEERKEIVDYCLSHECNYSATATKFNVSYSQVHNWVRKFKADPDKGLLDRRGYHKPDEELNELERLRRENKRLKKQLEENEMLVELLKKVKEFERM
ncbi:MAG: helix-turn-helix domain-containing protein [Phascolarctobacterium sp.]|nr:helix-turn-helix domain-containing protein [Phascolarctobacterium sp.]